ncbi:RNA 2',3'-cyclic phosphodiesterase [Streptomyces sp. H27-C3]|uniref:RNA 2',3'-cyclic phosphodiesterase n=1 Tax=Streptomyces sp. H27-C3 TaxID=3046305 RepID=UPI0032D95212
MRWTARAGWHFTLAFLGEVDDTLLPGIKEHLGRAAARHEPFPLRVDSGGHFGQRALWAGASGGLDPMRRLAERTDTAARRAGVTMEEHRAYRAHLTLARSRTGETDLRPYVEALAGFEGAGWTAGELALVRGNLPVAGVRGGAPRYETVAAWALGH